MSIRYIKTFCAVLIRLKFVSYLLILNHCNVELNINRQKNDVHCASDRTDNFSTHHLLITIIGRALTNSVLQSWQNRNNVKCTLSQLYKVNNTVTTSIHLLVLCLVKLNFITNYLKFKFVCTISNGASISARHRSKNRDQPVPGTWRPLVFNVTSMHRTKTRVSTFRDCHKYPFPIRDW